MTRVERRPDQLHHVPGSGGSGVAGGGYRILLRHTIVLSMSGPSMSAALAPLRAGHWNWARAGTAGLLSAAAITIPTDLIDTAMFSRMTPVRSWDYALAALAVVLTAAAAGLGRGRAAGANGARTVGVGPVTAAGAVALAVGCPLCNKLVIAGLGVSGALEFWAPIQPILGVVSVLLLGFVVVLRWHVALAGCRPTPPSGEYVQRELTSVGGSHEVRSTP